MKRLFLCAALALVTLNSFGWGRLGHATIAEIAERHLTPEARANISRYTGGEPLATWASWMDEVVSIEPYKTEFKGWHASIATPDGRSPEYVRLERRKGRDGVSAMEWFREYLREYPELPDSVVLQAIKCMTHIVGDFHCSAHVRYTDAVNELKYNVTFFGIEGTLHAVWDTALIQKHSGLVWTGYREYADRLDTWSPSEIEAATYGWAREWFEDCARDVRLTVKTIPEGAVLGQEFVDANIVLAELELRKAGYQLAKALNTIFGGATPDSGLWYLGKGQSVRRSGLVEGDAFEFSIPVETLPAGSWVEFGVSLENAGEKAPLHYMVEFFDGGRWVVDPAFVYDDGLAEHSFFTVSSSVRHPSTYIATYRLQSDVSDSLRVRCRVCSSYAADNSTLSASDPANKAALKNRHYVGAYLKPLGAAAPVRTADVLLIGNSFTYYEGEPFMLEEIAFSQGLRLNLGVSLKGGQTFRQHCGLFMTGRTLSRGSYDYAFIQGQSQEPAQYASDPLGKKDVGDAFVELCDMIREVSPQCRIFVENTWGYPGVSNGGFTSIEEFDRWLEEGCATLAALASPRPARSKKASVAPPVGVSQVGQAFTEARRYMNLLGTDAKHPGLAGAYLKACVTYLTIAGEPFSGEVPSCGLPASDAALLRYIAERVVLGR